MIFVLGCTAALLALRRAALPAPRSHAGTRSRKTRSSTTTSCCTDLDRGRPCDRRRQRHGQVQGEYSLPSAGADTEMGSIGITDDGVEHSGVTIRDAVIDGFDDGVY